MAFRQVLTEVWLGILVSFPSHALLTPGIHKTAESNPPNVLLPFASSRGKKCKCASGSVENLAPFKIWVSPRNSGKLTDPIPIVGCLLEVIVSSDSLEIWLYLQRLQSSKVDQRLLWAFLKLNVCHHQASYRRDKSRTSYDQSHQLAKQ